MPKNKLKFWSVDNLLSIMGGVLSPSPELGGSVLTFSSINLLFMWR